MTIGTALSDQPQPARASKMRERRDHTDHEITRDEHYEWTENPRATNQDLHKDNAEPNQGALSLFTQYKMPIEKSFHSKLER